MFTGKCYNIGKKVGRGEPPRVNLLNLATGFSLDVPNSTISEF